MTNRPLLSTLTTVDDNVMVGRQVWFSTQEPIDPGGICFGCGGARGSVAQANTMALVVNRSGGVDGWGAISNNLLSGPQLSRPMPICVSGDPEADCAGGQALSDVRAVFAGGSHACFILSNNTLKCFGEDTEGQLGGGTLVLAAAVGTAVNVCRTEVRTDTPPCADDVLGARAGEAVIAGAAGSTHTCVIIEGGRVMCWGSNSFGQLGDGTLERRLVPGFVCLEGSTLDDCNGGAYLANAIAIGAGEQHSCAILSGGVVRCWGSNSDHQLGSTDDNETAQSRPVTVCALGDENDGTCAPFFGAAQLASGGRFNCVVTDGGRVDCWGSDINGTLGNGDGSGESSRRQHPHPVCVTGSVDDDCSSGDYLTGVAQVAAGSSHACALLQDGTVSCWGDASVGQLGNGELSPTRSRPVSVCAAGTTSNACNGGVDLFSGAIGLSANAGTCALTHRGLKCWGSKNNGQLGPGVSTSQPNPIDICTDVGCPSIYSDSANRACGEVEVTLQ